MKTKTHKTNVLIVDDHVVVREGFVALVNAEDDMRACGQTDSAREALDLVEHHKPDVIVVDLILKDGDGLELIKSIRALDRKIAMLVVSMQDEEIYAERVLRAGALGYIMKSCATEEFLDAIRAVVAGQVYVSKKMNIRVLHEFVGNRNHDHAGDSVVSKLTDRELEIYQLIGSGMPTRDIASRLGISAKTVETHRENIKVKLGIDNSSSLVVSASRWVQQMPRE